MQTYGQGSVARRLAVTTALHRAGLAAARTEDPDDLYASVAASLVDVGFHVSIYALEGERARLVRSSFGRRAVQQDDFCVPLAQVPWFRTVMESADARMFDTSGGLEELFPTRGNVIGARVLDERHEPSGLLFLLGDDLDEADVPAASVFAQLLSVTLRRTQLLQRQKLEAIGRLAGGVAHDFNNLLTPALFAVDELETGRLDGVEHAESLATIRQTLEKCAELTRSLLAFGGRQMLSRRRVVLDDAVGEALRPVRDTFKEHVRVEWSPGAGSAEVDVDVSQLQHLLIKLALNAREAMGAEGTFAVTTRVLGDGWLALDCRDTGCGIAPEVLPRIFEPFFTTRGVSRGSGLGLAVVEGIVRQHEGTITVESTVGSGTAFRIRLREFAPVPPSARPERRGAGRRVLVVEDDALVRRTLVRILSNDGFAVAEAATLGAARDLRSRGERFDLVVTDVVLPDGKSTEEAVALARGGQRVLFVTGHALDTARLPVEFARLPLLMKPFGPPELLNAAHVALDLL